MVRVTIKLPAVRQYDLRVFAHCHACHSGIPSFIRFLNRAETFFHCFQMYIRNLRKRQIIEHLLK
jgi:hypothetical protein